MRPRISLLLRAAALCATVAAALSSSTCTSTARCIDDRNCSSAAPFCVDGICAPARASEGEGSASEGEGSASEGEGEGEGEGASGEGEGVAGGEGEGEGGGDCRVVGCPSQLGCVNGGAVDVGVCVPPPGTNDSCTDANQFFVRADEAPWIWRASVLQDLTGGAAAAYGCDASEHGVMFNFQYLDDEGDADADDHPVQVRSSAGTTTPPPENFARADTVAGHLGSITDVVCLPTSVTAFAFAFDDDNGNTSNAVCLP